MPKERRASHEEDRERRQTDVSHCVVAVTPRAFALVGQTGADLAQRPDHLCNGAHPALESMIEPAHKRKPLHAVGTNQEPTTCGISDSGHRTKGQRTRLNRIENRCEITARLDRLPMTRHMWTLVLLISLGGWFDTYAIFLTGSIAPGMFADKIFTPTTVSLFGFTGLASFIAALFTGLFIGTMFFTHMADHFGRRTVFIFSLVWYCLATLIMAFQTTPNGINFWRLVAGIGIGVELVTVDTFISELVPKHARGRTFAIQQSIGFIPVPLVALLAWLLNPTAPFGLSGWRWVVLIGSVGAIIVWFVRLKLPESPRWLAQQGRIAEADQVMPTIEAKVAPQSGGTLPEPEPPVAEDIRKGKLVEIFNPTYRSRTIML